MKKIYLIAATAFLGLSTASAQEISFGHYQNKISAGKDGINVFDVKKDNAEFKGLSAYVGGAFAMQFQGLNSFNDQIGGTQPANPPVAAYSNYRLNNLENQFNLPGANMSIGAQLADGVRVHMDLYLSARHHNETWVKGGYLQIDKLDFVKKDFMAGVMKYATIKMGQMENNYGDAHFRRTDNGNAIMNPFIEGNIMDSFQTDMGMEIYYNRKGLVSMIGITNGKLNQDVAETTANVSPTILAKLGYDQQLSNDLRVRITGSYNHNAQMSSNPWGSDRAGSRFYGVMTHQAYTYDGVPLTNNFNPTSNFTTGRFSPGYAGWYTAYMINPFVKYKGLELFGTIELTEGGNKKGDRDTRSVNQYVSDVVFRFGSSEQFYIGGRYGTVSGKLDNANAKAVTVDRLEASAGWFMTKNILAKLAYINQTYSDYDQIGTGTRVTPLPSGSTVAPALNDLYGGSFKGLMFEAVIAF